MGCWLRVLFGVWWWWLSGAGGCLGLCGVWWGRCLVMRWVVGVWIWSWGWVFGAGALGDAGVCLVLERFMETLRGA